MADDKKKEVGQHEEVEGAGDLTVKESGRQVKLGGDGRGLHDSRDQGQGRCDKDGGEVGEKLKAVVLKPATRWWEIQGEILNRGGNCMGDDIEGYRHDPSPLAGGKKKNVNKNSVREPKSIENKMPPAS